MEGVDCQDLGTIGGASFVLHREAGEVSLSEAK